MISPTLFAGSFAGFALAITFIWAGLTAIRRHSDESDDVRPMLLASWWWGVAAYIGLSWGVLNLFAALDITPLPLFVVVEGLAILPLLVGLLGLSLYLARTWPDPAAAPARFLALAWFVGIVGLIIATYAGLDPFGVQTGEWDTQLLFAPAANETLTTLTAYAIAVPLVLAAVAALRPAPFGRRRHAYEATAVALFFALIGIGGNSWDAMLGVVVRLAMTLALAALVLLAYARPSAAILPQHAFHGAK